MIDVLLVMYYFIRICVDVYISLSFLSEQLLFFCSQVRFWLLGGNEGWRYTSHSVVLLISCILITHRWTLLAGMV